MNYHHLLKIMLQSGQIQLQLDLHVPGTMKTFTVPNMFDASWNEKLKIDYDIYRIQCASMNKIINCIMLSTTPKYHVCIN